jgi:hypothetical protein
MLAALHAVATGEHRYLHRSEDAVVEWELG